MSVTASCVIMRSSLVTARSIMTIPILRPCPELAAYVAGLSYTDRSIYGAQTASAMIAKLYKRRADVLEPQGSAKN